MKLAVISDVHGNFVALEKLLPVFKEADRVVCLGDVAATGPQPRETIAALKGFKLPCVMGNTDERLANSQHDVFGRMPKEERAKMVELDRWTASQLDRSDRKYLSGFRATLEFKAGRSSVVCYHGSPRSNTEPILPTTPGESLPEILGVSGADLYLGGHTHAQMVRKFGRSLVVNPGSVGLPYYSDPSGNPKNPAWAEYAMVTVSHGDLRVELRRSPYRLSDLEDAVRRSGMPDPDWWMRDWV